MGDHLALDERRFELTRIVLRSLVLVQLGLVITGLLVPVTRTVDDEPEPLTAPGLFNAMARVSDPENLGAERGFFLVVAAVVVLALLGTGVVALLLLGGQWHPGRLPLLQYVLAGILILGALGLLLAGDWLGVEHPRSDRFILTEANTGGPAWGLWILLGAAAWAISLARGVQQLAE
ncbi:hypothetical protein [Microlunatus parietis]|uniref:Uncharacterized protein n=1 Tax=Microlunatus parietis TaxID=682979 RepID=A0A7Y9I687_9ACTN|nr:hypothetical protein [Microlunatus parietis]NYE70898.1 hypothetical protein [Microlunatus parietis]